ncbi:MAG: magnesium transporter MgtE, partial [Aliifodinibius sp.]|nr:magnesium transporter MgtE [Fodinibius sp.]NIV15961.1 magnesium transporter MgtE [Fodinibius sp.]NIY29916.1 magnesium transporter MgtE [Fodinibius sp.]
MTTDYIGLLGETTAQQAINFLRDAQLDLDVPYYLFVITQDKQLQGVIGLRSLVIARP